MSALQECQHLTEASNALVYAGTSGLSLTGGGSVGGFFDFTQGTAQTGTASHSKMWADTTAGNLQMINGTGSQQKVTGTVFAGTKALATGSITSTACHSDTLTATGSMYRLMQLHGTRMHRWRVRSLKLHPCYDWWA